MNRRDNSEKETVAPTAEAADGRWGALVIGEPVAPQALHHHHPFSRQQQQQQQQQQDATCVTGEAIPSSSSSPATVNSNYMEYSVHPFPAGTHHNPYVHISPAPGSAGKTRTDTILNSLNQWGKKFEHWWSRSIPASHPPIIYIQVKTSPSVTDAALARLAKGTKVLTEGGHEKSFQQTFGIFPGEKLLKTYACYLSTSSGPVIGTLYISTKRIAFCSDNPLCHNLSPGQKEWIYYKPPTTSQTEKPPYFDHAVWLHEMSSLLE